MKKSSILNFDPEELLKKEDDEEERAKYGLHLAKQFFEFFIWSPLMLMFLWHFSVSSVFNVKGLDYLQALCLNGMVKVLIRRVEDDKAL